MTKFEVCILQTMQISLNVEALTKDEAQVKGLMHLIEPHKDVEMISMKDNIHQTYWVQELG